MLNQFVKVDDEAEAEAEAEVEIAEIIMKVGIRYINDVIYEISNYINVSNRPR